MNSSKCKNISLVSCAKKKMSYTLLFLHLFHIALPYSVGITNLSAAELPDLGSSKKNAREHVSQSWLTENFVANEAVRLASPFASDASELTTLDKINNSTYKNDKKDESHTKSFSDSEKEYWINSAKKQVNSYVNEHVESALLGDNGVVKSELNFDDQMKLSGYALDVLYPLYEDANNTFFVQSGMRNNSESDRGFFNFGVGHRYINDSWLLGYNTFFDYELKRGHQRVGIGVEGAVDYFKAAVNYYHPLSDWKYSTDLEDHEEMPAQGVDARFKAYLPSYPNIAATATYEQYFGDDVAMRSVNSLEKNPYSSSLGVEWTPFPFITAGLSNKWTKGVGSEIGLDLNFNVKLGTSVSQMFSVEQVAKDRHIAGMRHDLVERNNEIVLKYRQSAPDITISHEPVSGQSGQVVQLSPIVTGGAEISSWRWRANSPTGMPDILQGFSNTSVPTPQVMLPLLPIDTLITDYSLYLDVTLNNGQSVSSNAIPVTVRADTGAFERQVKIISHPDGVIELSSTPVTVEWVLERRIGDAVLSVAPVESYVTPTGPGLTVEVQEGRPADGGGWINSFTLSQNAVAIKEMKELRLGQVNIQAKAIASLPLVESSADVVADGDPVHFQNAHLEVTSNNAVANGSETNEVSAIVVDAEGAPLAKQQVFFSAENEVSVTSPTAMTDAQGLAKTTLTSMVVGQSVVTARLMNGKSVFTTVSFQEDTLPDAAKSSLQTSRDSIVANGNDSAVITLTLKDANDRPLSGKNITLATSLMGSEIGNISDNNDGTYTANLSGTQAGLTRITAMVDGNSLDVSPVDVSMISEVAIVGDARVGQQLIAQCNNGSCSRSATYQWQIENPAGGGFIDIPGADKENYFVAKSDQKKRIQVIVNEHHLPVSSTPL